MNVWSCPNAKCAYDKELQSGQKCPLCGEEAKEFTFSELGNLLKLKWGFKKSVERGREERLPSRTKFYPKCGSTNLNVLVFYRPSLEMLKQWLRRSLHPRRQQTCRKITGTISQNETVKKDMYALNSGVPFLVNNQETVIKNCHIPSVGS